MTLAIQDQGPVASRTTLPGTSNTLFDDTATEIGIDQTLLCAADRFA